MAAEQRSVSAWFRERVGHVRLLFERRVLGVVMVNEGVGVVRVVGKKPSRNGCALRGYCVWYGELLVFYNMSLCSLRSHLHNDVLFIVTNPMVPAHRRHLLHSAGSEPESDSSTKSAVQASHATAT